MSNYDFIQKNDTGCTEEQFEMLLKTIAANLNSNIYDGSNHYAPKVGVCCRDGKYYWGTSVENKQYFLFYPSTEVIRKALAIFKEKGYYPYYDTEVRFYRVAKDKAEVKGEWTIRHTIWL